MPKVTQEYIDNKKKAIVEAAMRVCLRKPVGMVTMTDVIEESGLSQGGIYRFYKDLDEILRDMIIEMRAQYNIKDDTDEILMDPGDASAAQIVHMICDMLASAVTAHLMDLQKLNFDLTVLAINEPDRVKKILGSIDSESNTGHLMKMTRAGFIKAEKEGKIHPVTDVDSVINFMSAAANGILFNCIISAFYSDGVPGVKSDPKELYDALALSVIALLGVNENEG